MWQAAEKGATAAGGRRTLDAVDEEGGAKMSMTTIRVKVCDKECYELKTVGAPSLICMAWQSPKKPLRMLYRACGGAN